MKDTFTIRESGTDVSTYVLYTYNTTKGASLSDFENEEFFLEADNYSYNKTLISWRAPVFPIGATALPADVYIRWSTTGEPQTVEEGLPVLSGGDQAGSIYHTLDSDTYQGRWVYYSLFLRYASTNTSVYTDGEQYFEKVASVAVLLVKDYGSTDELWQRIPEYYRLQDSNEDLYNYLSIFGWDLDYFRTITDYLMVQKDPQIASSAALQNMMQDLGTIITTIELGASRARSYMEDIFAQRLAKGTEEGIINVLQELSGSVVTIDKANTKIKVSPQRVNWMRDPKIVNGLSNLSGVDNTWYGVVTDSPYVAFTNDLIEFEANSTKYPIVFGPDNASVAFNPLRSIVNNGTEDATLYLYSRFTIPVKSTDTFYFSAQLPIAERFKTVSFYYSSGTVAASASFLTGTVTNPDGKRYFKLSGMPQDGNVYVLCEVTVKPNEYLLFYNLMLENGYIGDYFDGNTNLGGWLLGNTNRSDYRWSDAASVGSLPSPKPEPYTTYSIYSADAWRTRKTITNVYKKLLPVNLMDTYTIVFDELPAYAYSPSTPTLPDVGLRTLEVPYDGTPLDIAMGGTGNAYPGTGGDELAVPNNL